MFETEDFAGEKGLEVLLIKSYEQTCAIISQHGFSKDPDNMPAIRFFQSLDIIKAQNKPNGQPNKGNRRIPARQ